MKGEQNMSKMNTVPGTLGLTEEQQQAKTQHGENKQITDGDYDKSLAVKCVNGTFVGKKTENVVAYKGIPFVGRQPVGELRWKAPVDVVPDAGVYEAYYDGKTPARIRNSATIRVKTACIWTYGRRWIRLPGRSRSWYGFTAALL